MHKHLNAERGMNIDQNLAEQVVNENLRLELMRNDEIFEKVFQQNRRENCQNRPHTICLNIIQVSLLTLTGRKVCFTYLTFVLMRPWFFRET